MTIASPPLTPVAEGPIGLESDRVAQPVDWEALTLMPQVDILITEDDTPVDNFPSEKQQRLLTEPLYSSWSGPGAGRNFLVAANVALFADVHRPPLVPDVFLSLDVQVAADWWDKSNRSYFFWEFGKPPEVVIEIVSNQKGEEAGRKLTEYARMGVTYYVIFDPSRQLSANVLRLYTLSGLRQYKLTPKVVLPGVGLGLQLWHGVYENKEDLWLRWCSQARKVIPTGAERAESERQRAESERQRAESERQRAEQELRRAEQAEAQLEKEQRRLQKLRNQLRDLGVEPQNGE